jgi:hypothetical protein
MADTASKITRRIVLFSAAGSLMCAPAIVRASVLMPVRGLPLQLCTSDFLNPEGEFYRRCFYHSLDGDLRAGHAMSVRSNEKIISVVEAQRMVACARVRGWLAP